MSESAKSLHDCIISHEKHVALAERYRVLNPIRLWAIKNASTIGVQAMAELMQTLREIEG